MASVKDIAPLQAETDQETIVEETQSVVEQEVLKLGQSIQESSSLGLQAATQTVIGNIPEMIRELTDDIKSGSIDNFSTAMNKLIKLVNDLGINLRDYNEDLADTVDKFTNKQMKLEDKLSQWREMGLKAEIKNGEVRLLTQRDVFKAQKEKIKNEKLIETKIAARDKLQANIDNKVWENSKARTKAQKDIIKNEEDIAQLRLENEEIDKKTGADKTADTGRDTGMSKFTELKEAFMVIPDTIGDAMSAFGKSGKTMFTGLAGLFKKGGLAKAFKGLVNFFKTARIMIMAKFLLVVAAIQFVAEKIDVIAAFFKRIFDKIAGFFKSIGDWFANSWIGRKLGLGGDDDGEADKIIEEEKKKEFKAMDDGTYAVGEDGAEIKDDNLSVRDILQQNEGDASVAEIAAMDDRASKEGDKKRIVNKTSSMKTTDDSSDQLSIEDIIGKKEVQGDQLKDGSTSSMLKSLESESAKSSQNSVINIQNNTNQNNSQSSATNVSGFIHHEPDESFKYVKKGSTGSADF